MDQDLKNHLKSGATTTCRCWQMVRVDGQSFGFTDHDESLEFDGQTFAANGGMTSSSLETANGLAADTGEAVGILSHATLDESDLKAGLFDGAKVCIWLVNWADVDQRDILFAGDIGEISAQDGAFRAELLGIEMRLNRPRGKYYQKACPVVLGDSKCGIDLDDTQYRASAVIQAIGGETTIELTGANAFSSGWFAEGVAEMATGPATGRRAAIMKDIVQGASRTITLWSGMHPMPEVGDEVVITAGCDRRFETCRSKFHNGENFRGFPHLPGDDWVLAVPRSGVVHDGGSLNK